MQLYIWLRDYIYHRVMAFVAALVYWFPSRQLTVIGVTGTKGKSTVVELIAFILEKAGKKVVVSSSVRNDASGMTMPGRFFIQRLLRRGVRIGAEYAVIEVTSQGILQSRHRFISWDVAVFTNLAPEHIEAHGGFENYRAAKVSFFRYVSISGLRKTIGLAKTKIFVINKDDANARYFIDAVNLLRFHLNRLVLYGKSDLLSSLLGEFNQYNVGAAVAVAEALGISREITEQAIAGFPGVRGRMEFIQHEPFSVVIDYAVTPNSLEAVYKTLINAKRKAPVYAHELRAGKHSAKLLCVFGCTGGGRDRWKRPVMGEIAARYCDEIILTDDDSYDERQEDIITEIRNGCNRVQDSRFRIHEYTDRKEAIQKALLMARAGDIVAITGKGGDQWLRKAHGVKVPWSDSHVVRDILQKMQSAKCKAHNI